MTAAGCALFATSAMGADKVSETFESPADGAAVTTLANWTGSGTITASNYTAAVTSIGRPISGTTPGSKVLVVEGRVTCGSIGTALGKPATVDMMVQIVVPDDELTFPSGTDTTDIQVAVGVDTNATLKIYCKNKSGTAGWYAMGTTAYDVGSWHRVSFTFDYASQLCQVRVDGDPILTANGYFSNNTAAYSGQAGSWYKLAKDSGVSSLSSVEVIGSTAIDDLLVKDTTDDVNSVLPTLADASGTTAGVPNTWIEAQGITRAQATEGEALDDSGMTVAGKYAAGYDVADGKKFGVKTMTLADVSGTPTATITFDPANVKTGYTYVLSTSTDKSDWSDATTLTPEQAAAGTVSVTLDAPVKYLKLKVVK
jgi:hypothetical protein